ncbi:hypothetical protein TCON_2599 [Astathelohania contejeani]|uniref:C2H2-type domain-containing protein n=1 Tax=Astathelohania contejeani TaxID=164912 RepID=A0ABQ7HVN6_9MICR|nr:hypothetical protein TCON_2599 [Thelohania contejeani]
MGRRKLSETESLGYIYKCFYNGCTLEYNTAMGLKRHIANYDHSLFNFKEIEIKCPITDCSFKGENLNTHFRDMHPKHGSLLGAYLVQIEKIIQRKNAKEPEEKRTWEEGIESIRKKYEDVAVITLKDFILQGKEAQTVVDTIFPRGVVQITEPTATELIYYCPLPHCGKHFRSILAYRYHCSIFPHSFRSLVAYTEKTIGKSINYDQIRYYLQHNHGVLDTFVITGITHHAQRLPDQFFIFSFSLLKAATIAKTRRTILDTHQSVQEYNMLLDEECLGEDPEDSVECPTGIIFNGERICVTTKVCRDRFTFINAGEKITCAARIPGDGLGWFAIAVGGMTEVPPRFFEFSKGNSQILFYTPEMELDRQFNFGYGYIRKLQIKDRNNILAVFNDGKARKLNLEGELLKEFVYDVEGAVDIIGVGEWNRVIINDGHRLYQFLDGKLECASTNFASPILSMDVKESESNEKDENKKGKIFFCSINGNVMWCDLNFRNEELLLSNVGVTYIKYLREVDSLFMSDTFDGNSRILGLDGEGKKSTFLSSSCVSALDMDKNYLLAGGYDGTVRVTVRGRSNRFNEKILGCVRRKDNFIFCCRPNEFAFLESRKMENFDYLTSLVDVLSYKNFIYCFYRNGFIVKIDKNYF